MDDRRDYPPPLSLNPRDYPLSPLPFCRLEFSSKKAEVERKIHFDFFNN